MRKSTITILKILIILTSYTLVTPLKAGDNYYYPPTNSNNNNWAKKKPASLGWDIARLNDTIDFVGSKNSTAFIILHKGRIVTENYWQGWDSHTNDLIYSATKTIVGFMTGQAQEQGFIDIENSASTYLGSGWSNAPRFRENRITLEHLLQMTSGLNNSLFYAGPPNTIWNYNNEAYFKVFESISAATGLSNQDYSEQFLFTPIGMHDSNWNFSNQRMISSARDMARFGLMLLGNGTWNGQNIISDKAYLSDMLNSSQNINPSYGYLTWLNAKNSYILPEGSNGTDWLIPEAPQDLIGALGKEDKKIHIIPSLDLVVVRHGAAADASTAAPSAFDNEIWTRLCAAIPGCNGDGNPTPLLVDNFENFNDKGWSNIRVNPTNTETRSGNTAMLCNTNGHQLTSPILELSNYNWIRIEFWYHDHGIDDNDVRIQALSSYPYLRYETFDHLNSPTNEEDTWQKYSKVITREGNPDFFQGTFQLNIHCRGLSGYGNQEKVLILDDIAIYAK